MKKLLFALLVVGLITVLSASALVAYATSGAVTEKRLALMKLKKVVARDLHDPESVRFRDLRLMAESDHLESFGHFLEFFRKDIAWTIKTLQEKPMSVFRYGEHAFALCGQLNAKNRMGAYVGYTSFFVGAMSPKEPFVAVEGLGWDKKFIDDMCETGFVVLQPPDEVEVR